MFCYNCNATGDGCDEICSNGGLVPDCIANPLTNDVTLGIFVEACDDGNAIPGVASASYDPCMRSGLYNNIQVVCSSHHHLRSLLMQPKPHQGMVVTSDAVWKRARVLMSILTP